MVDQFLDCFCRLQCSRLQGQGSQKGDRVNGTKTHSWSFPVCIFSRFSSLFKKIFCWGIFQINYWMMLWWDSPWRPSKEMTLWDTTRSRSVHLDTKCSLSTVLIMLGEAQTPKPDLSSEFQLHHYHWLWDLGQVTDLVLVSSSVKGNGMVLVMILVNIGEFLYKTP